MPESRAEALEERLLDGGQLRAKLTFVVRGQLHDGPMYVQKDGKYVVFYPWQYELKRLDVFLERRGGRKRRLVTVKTFPAPQARTIAPAEPQGEADDEALFAMVSDDDEDMDAPIAAEPEADPDEAPLERLGRAAPTNSAASSPPPRSLPPPASPPPSPPESASPPPAFVREVARPVPHLAATFIGDLRGRQVGRAPVSRMQVELYYRDWTGRLRLFRDPTSRAHGHLALEVNERGRRRVVGVPLTLANPAAAEAGTGRVSFRLGDAFARMSAVGWVLEVRSVSDDSVVAAWKDQRGRTVMTVPLRPWTGNPARGPLRSLSAR